MLMHQAEDPLSQNVLLQIKFSSTSYSYYMLNDFVLQYSM